MEIFKRIKVFSSATPTFLISSKITSKGSSPLSARHVNVEKLETELEEMTKSLEKFQIDQFDLHQSINIEEIESDVAPTLEDENGEAVEMSLPCIQYKLEEVD